jgi:hypothetical protein
MPSVTTRIERGVTDGGWLFGVADLATLMDIVPGNRRTAKYSLEMTLFLGIC